MSSKRSASPSIDDHSARKRLSIDGAFGLADAAADISRVVDTLQYPIHDLDGEAAAACIQKLRDQWKSQGSATLPGFIRADVIEKLASQVSSLPSHRRQWFKTTYATDTAYGAEGIHDMSDSPSHPLNRKFRSDVEVVAGDLVTKHTLLRQVYESHEVMAFFARVLGKKELYLYEDELQGLNIMYMRDTSERAWHYDGSDFVVTLMIQEASGGGTFEFAPFIRGERHPDGKRGHVENFDAVEKLFEGRYPGLVRTKVIPGTLNIFSGNRSLHRVLPTVGPQKRILAVLSYDTHAPSEQTLCWPSKNVELYGDRVRQLYSTRGIDLDSKERLTVAK